EAALGFDRAADLYALALRLRGEQDPDGSIRVKLAEALANAGRNADAGRVYEDAAECTTQDSQLKSMLHGRAAEQYLYGGYLERGMAVLRDVLRDIGMSVPPTPAATRRAALALRLRFIVRGMRFRLPDPSSIQEDAVIRLDTIWRASKGTAMLD